MPSATATPKPSGGWCRYPPSAEVTLTNNDNYEYDNEAIKALKDVGFKIAFGGGNVNATRNSNKFVVPRYPIHDSTSLDRFIKIVN